MHFCLNTEKAYWLFIILYIIQNGQRRWCCIYLEKGKECQWSRKTKLNSSSFRLNNSTLLVVPFPQSLPLSPSFTESASLLVMPFLLVPSFGTTWSANTRSARSKVKLFLLPKSTKSTLTASRTTVLSFATWPVLLLSTCTKSTVMSPSVVLCPRCTPKWPAAIPPVLRLSRSSVPASFPLLPSDVTTPKLSLNCPASSPRLTSASAHPPRLTRLSSRLRDPPSSEDESVRDSHYRHLETCGRMPFANQRKLLRAEVVIWMEKARQGHNNKFTREPTSARACVRVTGRVGWKNAPTSFRKN